MSVHARLLSSDGNVTLCAVPLPPALGACHPRGSQWQILLEQGPFSLPSRRSAPLTAPAALRQQTKQQQLMGSDNMTAGAAP